MVEANTYALTSNHLDCTRIIKQESVNSKLPFASFTTTAIIR